MATTYKKAGAKNISRIDIGWTSASDGSVSVDTNAVQGKITRVSFTSAYSGGTQPTDQYDATLTDEHDYDLLASGGANRSNAAATTVVPTTPIAVDGVLTLNITNAGNAKSGTVVVYLE